MTTDYRTPVAGIQYRIQVTESITISNPGDAPSQHWHWARYDPNGIQIDGSGPQRNGFKDFDKLKEMIAKKFPEDVVEGLGE